MISPPRRLASSRARELLPTAVGPEMTNTRGRGSGGTLEEERCAEEEEGGGGGEGGMDAVKALSMRGGTGGGRRR